MDENYFFNRDLSWLSFNGRVLTEAAKEELPLGERINFLAIYSSNLDEFYRVRIPALMAIGKIKTENETAPLLSRIQEVIDGQQILYGKLLLEILKPLETDFKIRLLYRQPVPVEIKDQVKRYFYTEVMAFLRPVFLKKKTNFFPENNKCYFAVSLQRDGETKLAVLNIPSESLGRFYSTESGTRQYILFLDDVIAEHLHVIFPDFKILEFHSFKITRDAELDLTDEYEGDLVEKIEKQLLKRDMGYATRFLYDSTIPEQDLKILIRALNLKRANKMAGGPYHNLRDLSKLPLRPIPALFYEKWEPIRVMIQGSVFDKMDDSDFMLHPPYESYDTVLQFFNEAALDPKTSEIYTTIYRMASDSKIAQALISAAKNGKKVTVFIEVKARFDEANNIRWAKKMQSAGVQIIYSIPGWKVHGKVALVKRVIEDRTRYYGILGTGNFNESTAKIYCDHILFTSSKEMLRELELLFMFLSKRKRLEENKYHIDFDQLLVAQFNLLPRFISLIDFEIDQAKKGKPAEILIKLNNLNEKTLINKLYEASSAGVKIQLIVRGICQLIPQKAGLSENITVRRIVDRYLEHTRVFIFKHAGEEQIFAGSSDWMDRNIYRRIEVCFPIYNQKIQDQIKKFISFDLQDNRQASELDEHMNDVPVTKGSREIRAQKEIYQYLKNTI